MIVDGGAGPNGIRGSAGADLLFGGGDGDGDYVDGNGGNDFPSLGAGNDIFEGDPGDCNDNVEAGDGTDTLRFNGSDAAKTINILANGGRVLLLRDVGSVVMDLNDLEILEVRAKEGTDTVVIGDLSGADVTRVDLNLRRGDEADSVIVNGAGGPDSIVAATDAGHVTTMSGLQAELRLKGSEELDERLTINGLGGDDVIDGTALDGVRFAANGGLGDDVLLGGDGDAPSLAATATTGRRWERATTPWSGIRATTATSSMARRGSTPCSSTGPTSQRPSTSSRISGTRPCSATSPA